MMTREEQIETYLEAAEQTKATEYYLEMDKNPTVTLKGSHQTNVDWQLHLWNGYQLTRQELTDYHDKKRGAVRVNSVQSALAAMDQMLGAK